MYDNAKRSEGVDFASVADADVATGSTNALKGMSFDEATEAMSPFKTKIPPLKKGQKCPCGGTALGEIRETEPAQPAPEQFDADAALEAEYAQYLNPDPAVEAKKVQQVAKYNQVLEGVNAKQDAWVEERYETSQKDGSSLGLNEMFGPEDPENAWTGYQGDLKPAGGSPGPSPTNNWTPRMDLITDELGANVAKPLEGGGEAVDLPVKSYQIHKDSAGKETTIAHYGFAEPRPDVRWQVFAVPHWCPAGEMGVLSLNKAKAGKRTKQERRGKHSHWEKCCKYERRDTKGLAGPIELDDEAHAKRYVNSGKRKDLEALKAWYGRRDEFIKKMADTKPAKSP